MAGWALGALAYLAAPWCERKLGELDSLVFAGRRAEGEGSSEGGSTEALGPSPMDLP